jgi:putative transposase
MFQAKQFSDISQTRKRPDMRKTFKYRATISKTTENNAFEWLYLCRTLYNLALEQRILAYRYNGQTLTAYDQINQLPELKKEFPEFAQVGSQCLQDVINRLDKAYKAFFRRIKTGQKAGFPRFKGKHRYDSFTLKQAGWKMQGRYLYVRNVGRFKLRLSRPIRGDIKTVTIRHTKTGKWFVCFSCDNVPEKTFPKTTQMVGIDVGLKSFCVDSDATSFDNPKYYRRNQRKLRRLQRSLSRKKKGSANREKARLEVAKMHERISNQRSDFLHKVANHYIINYDKIFVEDLKITNMVKNSRLSKSIADAGWGMFFEMLCAKAVEAGRTVQKVKPHGTSQICSICGEHVAKTLSVRVHKCPNCSVELDRDLNAALNILAVGQTVSSVTCGIGQSVLEESHAL